MFFNITTPKFAAQAIKKIAEIDWKPLHYPQQRLRLDRQRHEAGRLRKRQDIISAAYLKDVSDPQWDNDAGMKEFLDFLAKDFPEGNKLDGSVMVGYGVAQTLVQVLKQCGDDLTRENVMKQAASLKDFRTEVLLPGIKINTSADRFRPDQPASADEVQGREVGTVRRHHHRRRRRLIASCGARAAAPRSSQTTPAGLRCCGGFLLRQSDG